MGRDDAGSYCLESIGAGAEEILIQEDLGLDRF
jgi:hypothetical protein